MFRLEKTMYITMVIYKNIYIYTEKLETSVDVSSPSPSAASLSSPAPRRGPLAIGTAVLGLRGGEASGFYYKTFINIVSNKKLPPLRRKNLLKANPSPSAVLSGTTSWSVGDWYRHPGVAWR
jgi:hypothetical protein